MLTNIIKLQDARKFLTHHMSPRNFLEEKLLNMQSFNVCQYSRFKRLQANQRQKLSEKLTQGNPIPLSPINAILQAKSLNSSKASN